MPYIDVKDSLLKSLSTGKLHPICQKVYFYDTVQSTQDVAISLAESNSDLNNTLVIAGEQSRGKGRSGQMWKSPFGGIWFSLILKPNISAFKSSFISFIASLSVCDAIQAETGLNSKIKWPNDIVINSKKVSGILISVAAEEEALKYTVIGVGINSNLDDTLLQLIAKSIDVPYQITSLKNEMSNNYVDCGKVIMEVLRKIDFYFEELKYDELGVLNRWKIKCETINKRIQIVNKDKSWYEGIASDVDLDGSLLVKVEKGDLVRIFDNEVTIRTLPF